MNIYMYMYVWTPTTPPLPPNHIIISPSPPKHRRPTPVQGPKCQGGAIRPKSGSNPTQ